MSKSKFKFIIRVMQISIIISICNELICKFILIICKISSHIALYGKSDVPITHSPYTARLKYLFHRKTLIFETELVAAKSHFFTTIPVFSYSMRLIQNSFEFINFFFIEVFVLKVHTDS